MSSENFIDFTIRTLLESVNKKALHLLLSKDEDWEQFVADTEITRDEAKAIREGLKKHVTLTKAEVNETHQQEKEFTEKFLELYPQVKRDVEHHIAQYRALADRIDDVHKRCATANTVANSVGITSGILALAGLSLAPFTAGLSLSLVASSVMLGTAAATTNVVSRNVGRKNVSSIEAAAKNVESTGFTSDVLLKLLGESTGSISSLLNDYKLMKDVIARIQTSSRSRFRPEKEFFNMSGGIGGVATALVVLLNLYESVNNSKNLQDWKKSSEKLRQRAQELEKTLMALKQIQERLKHGLIPSE